MVDVTFLKLGIKNNYLQRLIFSELEILEKKILTTLIIFYVSYFLINFFLNRVM